VKPGTAADTTRQTAQTDAAAKAREAEKARLAAKAEKARLAAKAREAEKARIAEARARAHQQRVALHNNDRTPPKRAKAARPVRVQSRSTHST
jgi:hypothetical protein